MTQPGNSHRDVVVTQTVQSSVETQAGQTFCRMLYSAPEVPSVAAEDEVTQHGADGHYLLSSFSWWTAWVCTILSGTIFSIPSV